MLSVCAETVNEVAHNISSENADTCAIRQMIKDMEYFKMASRQISANYSALLRGLNQLKQDKGREELKKAILTVVNDEILSRLLQDLFATEATLAKLRESHGTQHPEFKSVAAMQADLDAKVSVRMDGILSGLKVKADAFKAQLDSLEKSVDEARKMDVEMADKYRPYSESKRKLENLERIRDAIQLRLLQEQVDRAVPRFKPEGK